MDLRLSPADLAFRDEVRAFLSHNLSADLRAASAANTGAFRDAAATAKWHGILYRKGWVAPDWPAEYGGTGWSVSQRHTFATECAAAGAGRRGAPPLLKPPAPDGRPGRWWRRRPGRRWG